MYPAAHAVYMLDPTGFVNWQCDKHPGLSAALRPETVLIHSLSQPPGEFWYDNHSDIIAPPLSTRKLLSFSRWDYAGLARYSQEDVDHYVTCLLDDFVEYLKEILDARMLIDLEYHDKCIEQLRLVEWKRLNLMVLRSDRQDHNPHKW